MWLSNHKVEHILIFLCSSTTALSLSLSLGTQRPSKIQLILTFFFSFWANLGVCIFIIIIIILAWADLAVYASLVPAPVLLHSLGTPRTSTKSHPFFLFFLGKSGFFFWCGCLIRKTLNSGRSMEWLNSIFKINGMHTLFYEWLKYKIHYSKMLTSHEQLIRFHA